ncbi:Sec-independent protein translocase subunit TatA/TatB [Sphingobacterium hungaricum]|uniref:Sec-independent protein translocase protein TatA n=1 Tax=Sphingobacterium hungaricum TaxID=2082723 RepID=A0A928UWD3_9SPHI|nr:twin-arginine translocase TatA/TatE family subunit [Sphingobacterium hungaricum]MBE8712731.1 twin-arginine translocase TatA/TatE family subunit [Sphingobacterium hungaricum]
MNLAFLNIGTQEMMLIVIVILLLFGGKKLPELARGLGKGIREFKDASEGIKREISDQINNFEKDLDVKAEDKPSTTQVAQVTEEVKDNVDGEATDETSTETAATDKPQFTAPEGTYQHQPGREPDYGQDNYYQYGYNDHFAGEKPEEVAAQAEESNDTPESTDSGESKDTSVKA